MAALPACSVVSTRVRCGGTGPLGLPVSPGSRGCPHARLGSCKQGSQGHPMLWPHDQAARTEAGHPGISGGGAAPLLCEFLRSHRDGPRGRTRGHICPDPGSTMIFFPIKELVGARAQPDELLCCRAELSVRLGPGPTHTPRRARVCTRTQAHVMSGHGAEEEGRPL